jgi:hypothetical protein
MGGINYPYTKNITITSPLMISAPNEPLKQNGDGWEMSIYFINEVERSGWYNNQYISVSLEYSDTLDDGYPTQTITSKSDTSRIGFYLISENSFSIRSDHNSTDELYTSGYSTLNVQINTNYGFGLGSKTSSSEDEDDYKRVDMRATNPTVQLPVPNSAAAGVSLELVDFKYAAPENDLLNISKPSFINILPADIIYETYPDTNGAVVTSTKFRISVNPISNFTTYIGTYTFRILMTSRADNTKKLHDPTTYIVNV